MFKEGQQVGRYRIRSLIGAGGMGKVFLADDLSLNRLVALKILPENFASDHDWIQRFLQEARATSALNHPNILTIHEAGTVEGTHFIASEFIQGEDLRAKLGKRAFDILEILDIGIQVASALEVAHQARIIHRDIKPENLILRDDGLVKVLDFGLAKLTEAVNTLVDTDAPTRAQVKTASGVILGTVAYNSPEQARGKTVDERSDLWSLGVVLYELVAGKRPFDGETNSDILASILTKDPKPFSPSKDIPPELERITLKILRKDREERYQTAKELLVDLKEQKNDIEFQLKLDRTVEPNHLGTQNHHHNDTDQTNIHATSSAEYVVNEIKRHPRGVLLAVTVLVLSALVLAFGFYRTSSPEAIQIAAIGVMPFNNDSGNIENDYLSDGLTESLISSLSQLPNLSVKARTSVFRYKGKELDLRTLRDELQVQAVLLGSVAQRGELLTLNMELVDTITENVIWSEQYRSPQTDIVSLQSEIARDVSNKLRQKLTRVEEQRVTKRHTTNADAYKLYLQGRYHWNKRTEEGVKRGIDFFAQAIATDPRYALAYAGLADSYIVLPVYSNTPSRQAHAKAIDAASKALEIDSTLAEAHASMAALKQLYEWNFASAEKEYQKSIELNPNYSTAYLWYAWYLSSIGRHPEAISQIQKAHDVDPLSLIVNSAIGNIYTASGQPDAAIAHLQKTIQMDRTFARSYGYLGDAYIEKGMYPDAIEAYKRADSLSGRENPESAERRAQLLLDTYLQFGTKGYWQKNLELIKDEALKRYISPTRLAAAFARAGDRVEAFRLLEMAFRERDQYLFYNLKIDPSLADLRTDDRYQDLLRRIGLP